MIPHVPVQYSEVYVHVYYVCEYIYIPHMCVVDDYIYNMF